MNKRTLWGSPSRIRIPKNSGGHVSAAVSLMKSSFFVPAGRSENWISAKPPAPNADRYGIPDGSGTRPPAAPKRARSGSQRGAVSDPRPGPLSQGCLAHQVFSPLRDKKAVAKRREKPYQLEKWIPARECRENRLANVGKSPTNWISTFHGKHDSGNTLF